MRVVYGSALFPVNGSTVSSRTETSQRSAAGRPVRQRVYLDVEASYIGTGVRDLADWENSVRAALAVPYQNLYLADDNGIPTSAALSNPASISGVCITDGPNFPETQTPEWVRVRTVRFSGYAEFLLPNTAADLISWTQTISIQGNGGPVRRWQVPVNDDYKPIRQRISPYSIIRLTQAGAAVGNLVMPPKPAPVWDFDYLVNEAVSEMTEPGKPIGKAWVEPVVRWNYIFEASEMMPIQLALPAV